MPVGDGMVNALRLTGTLGLPGYGTFTDSPTLNGPKIIPVTPPLGATEVEVGYTMGGGYSTFTCRAGLSRPGFRATGAHGGLAALGRWRRRTPRPCTDP